MDRRARIHTVRHSEGKIARQVRDLDNEVELLCQLSSQVLQRLGTVEQIVGAWAIGKLNEPGESEQAGEATPF